MMLLRRLKTVGLAVLAASILVAAIFYFAPASARAKKQIPGLTLVAARPLQPQPAGPINLIIVHVDPAGMPPSSGPQLDTVIFGPRAPLAGSSLPQPAPPVVADWIVWSQIDGKPAATTTDWSPPTAMPAWPAAYAATSQDGVAVLLVNHTDLPVHTRLRIRLRTGIYKVMRLSFDLPAPDEHSSSPVQPEPTSAIPAAAHALKQYLEGGEFRNGRVCVKDYELQPHGACVYRFTDVALDARLAWYRAQQALRALDNSSPSQSRRLRAMLDEGEPYLSGVSSPSGSSRKSDRRIGSIHRLLLVAFQAQSLYRNYQSRGVVREAPGGGAGAALDWLIRQLSETSGAALGLIPQVELGNIGDPQPKKLSISLCNTGGRSVELVKLSMDPSSMPQGVSFEPRDSAVIQSLHPGQTITAVYHLSYRTEAPLERDRCVAQISYFASRSAAHIVATSW